MICYNHAQVSAIGICGGCLKALCPSCAREGEVLACSDNCAAKVERFWVVTDKSYQVLKSRGDNIKGSTNAFVGLVFIGVGISMGFLTKDWNINGFLIFIGILMIWFGSQQAKTDKALE